MISLDIDFLAVEVVPKRIKRDRIATRELNSVR